MQGVSSIDDVSPLRTCEAIRKPRLFETRKDRYYRVQLARPAPGRALVVVRYEIHRHGWHWGFFDRLVDRAALCA